MVYKESDISEKLKSFRNVTSDFLTTIGKAKYLVVVDDNCALYNKVRLSLLKYKNTVSVIHVKNYKDATLFVSEHRKNIKGVLIEFSPINIVNITTESIKEQVPVIVVPACDDESLLCKLPFTQLAYTLGF